MCTCEVLIDKKNLISNLKFISEKLNNLSDITGKFKISFNTVSFYPRTHGVLQPCKFNTKL